MVAYDLSYFTTLNKSNILVVVLLTLKKSKFVVVVLLPLNKSKFVVVILQTLNNNYRFMNFLVITLI